MTWDLRITPEATEQPNYHTYVRADTITVDATSNLFGANPTPPAAIKTLIEHYAPMTPNIDTSSFAAADAVYNDRSYYVNAAVPSTRRLAGVVKQLLFESLGWLSSFGGKVRFVDFRKMTDHLRTADVVLTSDDHVLNGRKIKNTAMDDLCNTIIVNGESTESNDVSIAKYGEHSKEVSLEFLSAGIIYDFQLTYLTMYSTPMHVLSLETMPMQGTTLERGDFAQVPLFYGLSTGVVIDHSIHFGRGTASKAMTRTIKIIAGAQDNSGSGSGSGSGSDGGSGSGSGGW
jgi:hypothetical protein